MTTSFFLDSKSSLIAPVPVDGLLFPEVVTGHVGAFSGISVQKTIRPKIFFVEGLFNPPPLFPSLPLNRSSPATPQLDKVVYLSSQMILLE